MSKPLQNNFDHVSSLRKRTTAIIDALAAHNQEELARGSHTGLPKEPSKLDIACTLFHHLTTNRQMLGEEAAVYAQYIRNTLLTHPEELLQAIYPGKETTPALFNDHLNHILHYAYRRSLDQEKNSMRREFFLTKAMACLQKDTPFTDESLATTITQPTQPRQYLPDTFNFHTLVDPPASSFNDTATERTDDNKITEKMLPLRKAEIKAIGQEPQ